MNVLTCSTSKYIPYLMIKEKRLEYFRKVIITGDGDNDRSQEVSAVRELVESPGEKLVWLPNIVWLENIEKESKICS